ncbi:MAG: LamG domain-containing protein [Planctomycetota bacterium]
MEFYFCERCGKRLTAADIEQGLAKNKKLTGVYCNSCAVGALTVEMVPVDIKQAREVLRAAAGGAQTDKQPLEPQSLPARHGPGTRARVHAEPVSAPASARTKLLAAALVGAALVLVVLSALLLLRGGKPRTTVSSANPAPQKTRTPPVPERAQPPVAQPARPVQPLPVPRPTPPTPVSPPGPRPLQNTDAAAEAAFDILLHDTKPESRERAANLEQFLQKYGEATVAPRARALLAQLKHPEPPPVVAPPPVVEPPPKPRDETAEARAAYEAFQEDFLNAVVARQNRVAADKLEAAQKNTALKLAKPAFEIEHKALEWLADIDAAVAKGGEKVRELEVIELKPTRGQSVRAGKKAPFQATGVKDGALQLSSEALKLSLPLATLSEETRQRLLQLGLGEDGSGLVRRAFLELLTLSTKPDFQSGVQAALKRAQQAGAAGEDVAALQSLAGIAARHARESAAAAEWEKIGQLIATKQWCAAEKAAADFMAAFQTSRFANTNSEQIQKRLPDALRAYAQNEGLLGWWRFDEGQGTRALDSSGKGNHGTIAGATWTEGHTGTALQFAGNGFVEITGLQALAKTTPKGTVALWVCVDAAEDGGMLFMHVANWCTYIYFDLDHCHLGLCVRKTASYSAQNCGGSAATIQPQKWNHVALASDGARYLIYVNGQRDDKCTQPAQEAGSWFGAFPPDGCKTLIGKSGREINGSFHFLKGKVDDVRVYDRALTEAEIQDLFRAPPFPVKP